MLIKIKLPQTILGNGQKWSRLQLKYRLLNATTEVHLQLECSLYPTLSSLHNNTPHRSQGYSLLAYSLLQHYLNNSTNTTLASTPIFSLPSPSRNQLIVDYFLRIPCTLNRAISYIHSLPNPDPQPLLLCT